MSTQERFARALRRQRLLRELSQERLASRAGISAQHVSMIERGQKEVRLSTIVRLAHGLEMSPWELLLAAEAMVDTDPRREET